MQGALVKAEVLFIELYDRSPRWQLKKENCLLFKGRLLAGYVEADLPGSHIRLTDGQQALIHPSLRPAGRYC